jgi:hypothetical protein
MLFIRIRSYQDIQGIILCFDIVEREMCRVRLVCGFIYLLYLKLRISEKNLFFKILFK